MQEFGGKASKYAFSSALKSFGSKGSLRQGRTTHDHIIKSGHDTDVVIGTALVDMYAKCGSFEEARRAFDSCPHRDVVSWNAIISAYTDHGHGLLALDLFQKMQLNEGFLPNKVSFLLALKACAIEDIIWHGRLIHDHIIRSGIPLDEMFSSSLIDMYAKCGNLDDASAVFTNLPIKNVFSWGALMAGYAQHGLGFAALELFEKMRHDGVQPTPVIFSCILKACGSIGAIEQGRLVHDQIKENKLGLDPVISNALVDMYAKCGEFVEACKVLHELPYRSERSWGAIIGGYIQHGHFLSALQLFVKMQQEGRKANEVIYSCVLKACGSIGATNEGRIIHEQILRNKLESDVVVGNSIIDMYASVGSLIEARKIFDIFPKRNTGSWDAMIAGYTKHGHDAHALELFEKVQHDSLKPSEAMFSCVVKACGGLRVSVQGRSLHGQIVINLFIPDVVVVNSLIDMYLRCGSLEEARKVFDKSFNRDVVSWNSIIGGYVQSGHGLSALDLFHRMIQSGSKPDRVTYLCMVKACGTTGALRQGRFMHEQIVESGFESDVAVRISLVDMFARCGSLEEARKLLDGTARSDAGSWAAMIAGYAQHGECMLARECFHEMQRHGLKPDVATFTVVLAACCHAGQVEEGYWFFNAMKEDHGIIPRVEHFNCLIDLLGRAGRLSEASQLLKTMPGFPDIMGWMSLLTACRKYGDAKLGRKCFEEILHIDPDNSAVYTLMSNIYADAHMWDDVARLEKLRTCANAWKKPATAWIQVNDKLHEFMVGERDCPPNDSVNIRLKALKQQMEEEGYVPKLDLVSQQKPVEGSENTLKLIEGSERAFKLIESSEHAFNAGSKRLLVAFGLSSSLEGATLRPTRVLNMSANYRNVTFITSNAVKKKLISRDLYWSYLSRVEFFIVGLLFSFHYALKRKIGNGLV